MHDLVVRGGRVVDGTGAPARVADVAVDDGRIVEIDAVSEGGRRTIEAGGRVIAPGFVDVHTRLVGHSAIRRVVMGGEATERAATAAELEAMKELLRAGLRAGGVGFSSTWAQSHHDAAGRPVPSRAAPAAATRSTCSWTSSSRTS
ncbi:hypothetical protein FRACA_140062 [Frankia canadensis]|uniref:Amidohydrolase 3 domain-containing protein n=1 Tax=Frankia canadensis TaxID=1836972 RepID=A0A2I2KLD1_9ACTN|nr:hypothetical protein [Frankia canadensis]SNQ46463.1 hypothetical protein FRACA_140062 [Frankia canadensis]SOU53753.1 hypothetical protein FRACA_140062 [Frankia canadensis]